MDIEAAVKATWGWRPPRTYVEMSRAGLFDGLRGARGEAIALWVATGEPTRLVHAIFDLDSADVVAAGNAFVKDDLVEGLVPIGGDGSGDAWCFDTRTKLGGTTPVLHVSHDGGGATFVAPSFAAFVYYLLLDNLRYQHFYDRWGLGRAGLVTATRRNLQAAAPWLLGRWRRHVERVIETGRWPTFGTLGRRLAEDPAFARLPKGEQHVFR